MIEKEIQNNPEIPMNLWKACVGRNRKNIREGEALMNALYEEDPAMFEIVNGGEFDCFYNNETIPKFMEYIYNVYKK